LPVARVPLIDLKFLDEAAAVMQELQIGGTSVGTFIPAAPKVSPRA
jgi:fumarate hydratase class II